ncbi:YicC/YloC family endoribonuclease [Bacillus sp. V5-8f]|uniref:YicC/YloC family endoribonuclease n=1 Tax=Bacillus sp. V5-8f TaxID=2053044 RepID=UPI000C75CC10|nr:YicC/YloC family endoribonuclease [Bacillus sp. V5-8f]PLT34267.1 YicC family protein [Bacillus sp. V5-8f]
MVVSMTGYGIGHAENAGIKVTVEIKTVNHRFCEYHIRMPRSLIFLEDRVKKKANEYIRRGRVEIFIMIEGGALATKRLKVDWALADQYMEGMHELKDRYGLDSSASAPDLLHIADIFSVEDEQSVNEDIEPLLLTACEAALINVQNMRTLEGRELKNDLSRQLKKINAILSSLTKYAPFVSEQYKAKLKARISEFTAGLVDETRLLTEVAIFADKSDINEELTRLSSHLIQFSATLEKEEPIGRQLDFLVQEMNREANTIGSKANDAVITKEVVELKSLLEKIKEQSQNIE